MIKYNADGLVTATNQSNGGLTTIADYTMLYDADNELTKQIDHGTTTSFGYDSLGELTNYGTASQTYDADGNNTADTVGAGNEVTYDGTYHYGYDQEGNETQMYDASVTWSYSYDNENQMVEARETVSGTPVRDVNYEYDAFGSQLEESVATLSGSWSTTATEYVLDHWNPATVGATGLAGTNVVADVTATGSLITGYVCGNQVDQLFGRYDTSLSTTPTAGAYYLFVDRQGSVRDVVNSSGADVDSIKYDPWGNIVTQKNSGYQGQYTFASYQFDAPTGDYYLKGRRDDPEDGRMTSVDPDGIGGGQANFYAYAGNDPTNNVDPSGLWRANVNISLDINNPAVAFVNWLRPGALPVPIVPAPLRIAANKVIGGGPVARPSGGVRAVLTYQFSIGSGGFGFGAGLGPGIIDNPFGAISATFDPFGVKQPANSVGVFGHGIFPLNSGGVGVAGFGNYNVIGPAPAAPPFGAAWPAIPFLTPLPLPPAWAGPLAPVVPIGSRLNFGPGIGFGGVATGGVWWQVI